jgi:transmembrane sensor
MASVEAVAESGLPPADPVFDIEGNVVPLRHSRRVWIGGAVAACVAGALTFGLWQMREAPVTWRTAPGEMRELALADGTRVAMAGASVLSVDPDHRHVELVEGQALFTVRHDESREFSVRVGDDTLVDVGTVFEVRKYAAAMSVAVSEGAVMFNPEAEAVRVDPGRKLVVRAGKAQLSESPAALVGEWREGRLTFRDATLGDVAADLSRATGIAFRVAPGAAGRTISGSVALDPIRKDPAALGALLGVTVSGSGPGAHREWTIEP